MRIVFMGTPETAVPTLRACVEAGHEVVAAWTQPDRPAGRGGKLKASSVKEYAAAHGISVHQPARIKTEEARALFESHAAEVAIVVAYGRILPPAFLAAPRRGCINVHFSLLPKYRGAAPVNWAIVRGERETGVTTMLMDEGLDTGPLLLQRATAIAANETAPQLLARLAEEGAELLVETLDRFEELEPRPQRHAEATLAPVLRREDGSIDWALCAAEIARRVRGFQPWPNAHTTFRERRLIIWRAEPDTNQLIEAVTANAPGQLSEDASRAIGIGAAPGEIVAARGDEILVACGGGQSLRVAELQLEGKQRMRARDFVNGMRVVVGERLG